MQPRSPATKGAQRESRAVLGCPGHGDPLGTASTPGTLGRRSHLPFALRDDRPPRRRRGARRTKRSHTVPRTPWLRPALPPLGTPSHSQSSQTRLLSLQKVSEPGLARPGHHLLGQFNSRDDSIDTHSTCEGPSNKNRLKQPLTSGAQALSSTKRRRWDL